MTRTAVTGRALDDIPHAPKESTVRCHWTYDTNPDSGETVLIFIAGCGAMLLDPEHETCDCDNLERRMAIQLEQRRDCDDEITRQRRMLRKWARAGAAAYGVLTGRDMSHGGYIHPEELARAARRGD